MVALDTNSKADTRLFITGASAAALAVDQSQWLTDLTNNATYLTEAPSVRTGVTSPRELSVVVDVTNADTGIILNHGNVLGTDYTYRIAVTGGTVQFSQNGAGLGGIALPNVAAGARRYLIHWSTRTVTGGVSSAFLVHDYTSGEYAIRHLDHTVATTNAGWQLNVVGYGAGVSPFTGGLAAIYSARVGIRFHSTTEAREDWVTTSSAPSSDAETRIQPVPVTNATAVGTHASFGGPAYLWALKATREADWRLTHSPLVNHHFTQQTALQNTYAPDEWHRGAPGDPDFKMSIRHLFMRPVPPGINRLRHRVFVQTYATSGAMVPIYVRAYVLNRLPINNLKLPEPPPPIEYHYAGSSLAVDHTSTGLGQWLDLGSSRIAQLDGFSVIGLAYSINLDAGHIQEPNMRLRIRAYTAEPWVYPADDSLEYGLP